MRRATALPLLLAGLVMAGCSSAPPARTGARPPAVHPATGLPPQTKPVPKLSEMPPFGSDEFNRIKDAFPDDPPDVGEVADAEPVPEPRAKYGNKSPYTVLGKTYRVLPSAKGYQHTGKASWYGKKFHGLRTSSGEKYDMYRMTAAHRSLPLPSYARVTNVANGKSVIVKVNDRGPFHSERIMDLSYAAAARLDMLKSGTATVKIQAIDPAEYQAQQGKPAPAAAPAVVQEGSGDGGESFFVQVGAFSETGNATALQARIQRVVEAPVAVARDEDAAVNRVRVGPFTSREAADRVAASIRANGLGSPIIVSR